MHELNARNLLCPLPVIRLQTAVKRLTQGEIIEVICTDPGVLHDIPAWCRIHGHEVIATEDLKKEIRIRVKVGS